MLIEQTLDKLNAMKLGALADALQQQLQTGEAATLGFEERFGLLVEAEWTAREQRKLQRRLQTAKLRYPASLEAVDFTHPRRLHLPAAVERVLQRQFVHPPHQGQVLRALFPRRVVHRRAVDAKQRALAPDAQLAPPLDQLQACGAAQRCKPRRKKSRSTVNSPIFACKSRIVASCSESRDALPLAKTSSSPSTAWRFHAPTWFG